MLNFAAFENSETPSLELEYIILQREGIIRFVIALTTKTVITSRKSRLGNPQRSVEIDLNSNPWIRCIQ